MPVVDVEIVGAGSIAEDLAQRLADAVGEALGSRPGETWVRVRDLPRTRYAENRTELDDPAPVFVHVLRRQLPDAGERATEVQAVTLAVAEVVGRPSGRVHVAYDPPGQGRVAFGGRLVD